MAIYTITNRPLAGANRNRNDEIEFVVGETTLRYGFEPCYCANITVGDSGLHPNDEIFNLLGLDPRQAFLDANDEEEPTGGVGHDCWPECDGDSNYIPEEIANVVNYLFDVISERGAGNPLLSPMSSHRRERW